MTHFKRVNSVSVTELQTLSESIKRFAISVDGKGKIPLSPPNSKIMSLKMPTQSNVVSIMSDAKENFSENYNILEEIGRGGFSTVFKCQSKQSKEIYAVKVVDLRPLRLRERFNPARIRREVDIMRRLVHPNIIRFVDVFETADRLMMVMEYFPGDELFDVILARKYFTEADAKPIFAQICRALHYLHCLNIIHRDVKPENVLISRQVDPTIGYPIAKLVDFGLSKNAGAGSAAKTFVGTPCYLAPEVEYTSKGLGGTYGLPADCWSVGAVLYVMLVARFPEFETDTTGKMVLRLPPALWDNVSTDAKDLIRSLMNANQNARITIANALQHKWLGVYRVSTEELRQINLSCYDLSQGLQEEEERFSKTMNNGTEYDIEPDTTTMIVRHVGPDQGGAGDQFPLNSLLHLQRRIVLCFQDAHACFFDMPEVAAQIRLAASLCRTQLTQSVKMLRQVEQTAVAVLQLFPDLELAVEEGEPKLALSFFNLMRSWVIDLKTLVFSTQKAHKASMDQIQEVIEKSSLGLQRRERMRNPAVNQAMVALSERLYEILYLKMSGGSTNSSNSVSSGQLSAIKDSTTSSDRNNTTVDHSEEASTVNLSQEDILELFSGLFGQPSWSRGVTKVRPPLQIEGRMSAPSITELAESPSQTMADHDVMSIGESANVAPVILQKKNVMPWHGPIIASNGAKHSFPPGGIGNPNAISNPAVTDGGLNNDMEVDNGRGTTQSQAAALYQSKAAQQVQAAARLNEALENLSQIDVLLVNFGLFWNNTEVVLDVLTKKGQHVEQLIGFATKPKLMSRFTERLEEYKRFWESVNIMCSNYVAGVNMAPNDSSKESEFITSYEYHASHPEDGRNSISGQNTNASTMYSFLEPEDVGFKDNNYTSHMGGSNSSMGSKSGASSTQNFASIYPIRSHDSTHSDNSVHSSSIDVNSTNTPTTTPGANHGRPRGGSHNTVESMFPGFSSYAGAASPLRNFGNAYDMKADPHQSFPILHPKSLTPPLVSHPTQNLAQTQQQVQFSQKPMVYSDKTQPRTQQYNNPPVYPNTSSSNTQSSGHAHHQPMPQGMNFDSWTPSYGKQYNFTVVQPQSSVAASVSPDPVVTSTQIPVLNGTSTQTYSHAKPTLSQLVYQNPSSQSANTFQSQINSPTPDQRYF